MSLYPAKKHEPYLHSGKSHYKRGQRQYKVKRFHGNLIFSQITKNGEIHFKIIIHLTCN